MKQNFTDRHFLAWGTAVISAVSLSEVMVCQYIQNQGLEKETPRVQGQMKLWGFKQIQLTLGFYF